MIFEKVREDRDGGGLAIGCVPELTPAWVREGEGPVEALSVNIFVKKFKIRCCVAYGCQETDSIENKEAFWKYMNEEVLEASQTDSGLVMQFDGNLWAGDGIIPNDPRHQNRNGKLFKEFLDQNPHLTVINALSLCEGVVTRRRFREGRLEESVLDFFVVCHKVLPHVTKMVIDEEKKYVLTNYERAKKGGKVSDTDHATEYMDLDLKTTTEKPRRVEVWNFKDKEAQKCFKVQTSQTNEFSACFNNKLPVLKQIQNWKHVFKSYCRKSFKKVRLVKKKSVKRLPPELARLIDRRNEIMKINNKGSEEVNNLDEAISMAEAEINRNEIMKHFQSFSDNPENINLGQVWKSMNKICPKFINAVPSAKKDHNGRIVSAPNDLKKLLAKEYKERLRTRPVRPDLDLLEERKRRIFKMKIKLSKSRPSSVWTMKDLENALKDLKNNKSRDPEGLINELFKTNVIGEDLKRSLLLMFNNIKTEQKIPIFMNHANVTTIPKKGSPLILENQRGIFRVPVLRFILMRLIYNDKYPEIDSKMSDCQMGGRKKKGCRNNLFIINGIIHDAMSSKKKRPVCLQITDYKQMFDAMNLEQAVNDIYDAGINDDNLTLIYEANKNIKMAVNTPHGLSERQSIENVVLQGDTFGSILASVQVDSIGKELDEAGLGYKYKDTLAISMLGLVDDMVGVTNAGHEAHEMNAILNIKTAEKRLQFGPSKCKSMLVGKDLKNVQNNSLQVDSWKVTHVNDPLTGDSQLVESYAGQECIEKTLKEKYLGFILSSTGDNMANISEMKKKAIWIKKKVFSKLNDLNLKKYYFECAIVFLNVMLRSSILYACETYYNLKESELRELERIEESFLRKMFKTSRGCPISQLYLEAGQVPARFQAKKTRLLFLQYILQEDPESRIYKFLSLQFKHPTRGDWASSCVQDLKDLEINATLEEVKKLSKIQFNKILSVNVRKKAFEYLISKRGSKGQEISYSELKMADYLMPNLENLSIEDRRKIFEMRNRMLPISANFPIKGDEKKCWCGENEDTKHIYHCKYWNNNEEYMNTEEYMNNENEKTTFEEIFTDNLPELVKVFKTFEDNYQKRENYKTEQQNMQNLEKNSPSGILISDPLCSVIGYSNGNKHYHLVPGQE